jgi:23S rRNA (pseudouridine1915-N3)-methyltransferase
MKIYLGLLWMKGNRGLAQNFKHSGAFDLFNMYHQRLKPYADVDISLPKIEDLMKRSSQEFLCLCERSHKNSSLLSSEELAEQLAKLRQLSVKKMWIIVGPADGLSRDQISLLKPDLMWSFGPATFPHELASVMMLEQVYRAHTILAGHPYHTGH